MSQLIPVRKEYAGSDSLGHVWPKDGSIVEVSYEDALLLVRIPDGGFSIVEPAKGFPEGFPPALEPEDQAEQAPVRVVEPHPAPNAERAIVEPAPAVTEPTPAAVRAPQGKPVVEKTPTVKAPTTTKGTH